MFNRLANAHNQFQDLIAFPRTLVVCSAGMLRSPSIAWVLSNEPYNRNVRAAGLAKEYALIPVDQVLLEWADEIVCADSSHRLTIREMLEEFEEITDKKKAVYALNIPDEFRYRDIKLIKLIKEKLEQVEFPKYKGT